MKIDSVSRPSTRTLLLSEDYAKDLLVDADVPKGQGGVE